MSYRILSLTLNAGLCDPLLSPGSRGGGSLCTTGRFASQNIAFSRIASGPTGRTLENARALCCRRVHELPAQPRGRVSILDLSEHPATRRTISFRGRPRGHALHDRGIPPSACPQHAELRPCCTPDGSSAWSRQGTVRHDQRGRSVNEG